jgi:uncharacterized membrane protein YcaP (DUF421 family)
MHSPLWMDMFHLGLPIAEKILRSVIVYAFLVVGLRLAGKRELAQLNPFDLVVLLTLSNTVQNAIIGDDNSVTGGVIGAATLLLINYLFVRFLYAHPKLDRTFEGSSEALIDGGRLMKHAMEKNLITQAELEAVAHRQGFGSLEEVESATIEPGGTLCFVARKPMPDEARHSELLKRFDHLAAEMAQLRVRPAPPSA